MAGTGSDSTTSGSDTRQPRQLHPAIQTFDLAAEVEALRNESAWTEHGRVAKTLAKAPTYRLVLSLVRAGGEVGDDNTWGPLTLQVVSGSVLAGRGTDSHPVAAGGVAWFAEGPGWSARAETESALLLGITWPEEQAQDANLEESEPYRPAAGAGLELA